MNRIIKLVVVLFTVSLFAVSCGNNASNNESGHEEHVEEEAHEEGIVALTKQQMDAIGLKLVTLEKRNMNIGIQVTGKLNLAPQDRADISPIMGGIVKDIRVIEGDHVKKGQVLATLEHPDFIQLQQDYVNSVNNLEYLSQEYARQTKLYEEKVGSGKEFQKVSAEYNNEKSKVKALEIRLKMLGLNPVSIKAGTIYSLVQITSPMSGIISLVETNVGAYVEPLTKLFEVVDNSMLHADFRVYEKDVNMVRVGQKVYFSTASQVGDEFEGEIHAISPVFEENPRALHVHADISNKNANLIPGMYIQGRIIAENTLTTVLPDDAIVSENEKSYIFVKIGGEEHDHGHEEAAVTEEHDHENHTAHTEEKVEHEDHADTENHVEEDAHADHANEPNHADEDGHDEHAEGAWKFEMVEVMTGFSNDGFTEIKLLQPLPKGAEIAGVGAYYLLAEMGKGETEHTH